jgi:hypothetical protein
MFDGVGLLHSLHNFSSGPSESNIASSSLEFDTIELLLPLLFESL